MRNSDSVGTCLKKLISSNDPDSLGIDFALNLLNREKAPYTIREGYIKGQNSEEYKKFLEKRKSQYHHDELMREYIKVRSKERYYCIRNKCEKFSKVTTILNCPVCGKEFGVESHEIDSAKYCSKECRVIASRKSWRDESPYAKKIKKIKREQRDRSG